MKVKSLFKVMNRGETAALPVTRYDLEPIGKLVDFKGTAANPLVLRGLFIS